jgi:hypothetical protein
MSAIALPSLAWVAAGAAGAAIFFARHAWPSVGLRLRNLAAALLTVAVATLLSLVFADAWRLGVAWLATALLLQWSHMLVAAGRFVWLRAGLAAALVLVGAWLFGD